MHICVELARQVSECHCTVIACAHDTHSLRTVVFVVMDRTTFTAFSARVPRSNTLHSFNFSWNSEIPTQLRTEKHIRVYIYVYME